MPVVHLATGLLEHEGRVLLVASRYPNQPEPLWNLPGGRQQPGELLAETAVREVLEETGLHVEARELAYVSESYDGDVHFLNAIFVVVAMSCFEKLSMTPGGFDEPPFDKLRVVSKAEPIRTPSQSRASGPGMSLNHRGPHGGGPSHKPAPQRRLPAARASRSLIAMPNAPALAGADSTMIRAKPPPSVFRSTA